MSPSKLDSPTEAHLLDAAQGIHLLDLPLELRLMIYHHVFHGTHFLLDTTLRVPGLLCVNKQIRGESLDTFYKLSIMHQCGIAGFERLRSLLKKHLSAITEIRHHSYDAVFESFPRENRVASAQICPAIGWMEFRFPGKKVKGRVVAETEWTVAELRAAQANGEMCA